MAVPDRSCLGYWLTAANPISCMRKPLWTNEGIWNRQPPWPSHCSDRSAETSDSSATRSPCPRSPGCFHRRLEFGGPPGLSLKAPMVKGSRCTAQPVANLDLCPQKGIDLAGPSMKLDSLQFHQSLTNQGQSHCKVYLVLQSDPVRSCQVTSGVSKRSLFKKLD